MERDEESMDTAPPPESRVTECQVEVMDTAPPPESRVTECQVEAMDTTPPPESCDMNGEEPMDTS